MLPSFQNLKKTRNIIYSLVLLSLAILVILDIATGNSKEYWINISTNAVFVLISIVATYFIVDLLIEKSERTAGEEQAKFDYDSFIQQIPDANYCVRVLCTFIYPLTTDHLYQENYINLIDNFKIALKQNRNLSVDLLLINPFSSAAQQRCDEREDTHFFTCLTENLDSLQTVLFNEKKGFEKMTFAKRIHVNLYNKLPPFALFQIDDTMWVSHFSRNQKISLSRQFKFSANTPLGNFINKSFEELIKDSRTLSLSEFLFIDVVLNGENFRTRYVKIAHKKTRFYLLLEENKDRAFKRCITTAAAGSLLIFEWKDFKYSCEFEIDSIQQHPQLKEETDKKYLQTNFDWVCVAKEVTKTKK